MSGGGCGTPVRRRTAHRALTAALALVIAGCAAVPAVAPPPTAPPVGPAAPAAPASAPIRPAAAPAPAAAAAPDPASPLTAERIAARIAELEARQTQGRHAGPEETLELALLYIHPTNPAPDHLKALAAMRAYLALSAPASRDPLVAHLTGLLEDIARLGRLLRESRAREKELAAQAKELERRAAEGALQGTAAEKREQELLAQIQTLQRRIEQLQQLDLEMERRRRSVR